MQQQFDFEFNTPAADTPTAAFATEKRPLPVRGRPLPDESMSSWILRMLSDNWMKASTTGQHYFESAYILDKDLDRAPPQKLLKYVQSISGIDSKELNSLLLIGPREHIFEYTNDTGSTPYITALWRFKKEKEAERGLAYCPECLQEDAIPYFRKSWRYSFVTTCSRHKCLLEDQCPHCGKYFQCSSGTIHGPHAKKIDQMTCAYCYRSIVSGRKERNDCPKAVADAEFISASFLSAKANNWVAMAGGDTIHPIAWVQGVRDIQRYIAHAHMSDLSMTMLANKGAKGFMSLADLRYYTHGREEIDPEHQPWFRFRWMFEHCGVRHRAHINAVISHMLNNRWPESFVSSLQNKKARSHWRKIFSKYVLRQRKNMPFWIERLMPEVLGNQNEHRRHSKNHREGVSQHLKAKGYVVTSDSVRRYTELGAYPSMTKAETKVATNYNEILESHFRRRKKGPKAAWLKDKSSPYYGAQHITDVLS